MDLLKNPIRMRLTEVFKIDESVSTEFNERSGIDVD
jgi:hypothetical protein